MRSGDRGSTGRAARANVPLRKASDKGAETILPKQSNFSVILDLVNRRGRQADPGGTGQGGPRGRCRTSPLLQARQGESLPSISALALPHAMEDADRERLPVSSGTSDVQQVLDQLANEREVAQGAEGLLLLLARNAAQDAAADRPELRAQVETELRLARARIHDLELRLSVLGQEEGSCRSDQRAWTELMRCSARGAQERHASADEGARTDDICIV